MPPKMTPQQPSTAVMFPTEVWIAAMLGMGQVYCRVPPVPSLLGTGERRPYETLRPLLTLGTTVSF